GYIQELVMWRVCDDWMSAKTRAKIEKQRLEVGQSSVPPFAPVVVLLKHCQAPSAEVRPTSYTTVSHETTYLAGGNEQAGQRKIIWSSPPAPTSAGTKGGRI
ncbi:MAG: hypothetical protein ACYSTZ_06445, partial [Planctomycetota bacterium]